MNIAFISNYYNHHQAFLSESFFKSSNGQYRFIETSTISKERIRLGWGNNYIPDYVLKNYIDKESFERCQKIIETADVAILGSASYDLIRQRLRQRQLTFCYSERIYKKGYEYYKFPKRLISMFFKYTRHNSLYMLCASAFTAADYAKTGSFLGKTYKWGYFPECKYYSNIDNLIENKNPIQILWCGRMISWKHPDTVLAVAKLLKEDGYSFCINMVGTGEMEESLKQYTKDNGLENCINFLGATSPKEVRKHMENAGIYLFTSDRQEGWGAVLNESMNSGCAVVASHSIGSVPFLVKDGENALIYESENIEMLYKKVKCLLDNPELQKSLGKEAYLTITNEWNAEVAVERFINLTKHILAGESSPNLYESGPCSKAEIIKDNWYKEKSKK